MTFFNNKKTKILSTKAWVIIAILAITIIFIVIWKMNSAPKNTNASVQTSSQETTQKAALTVSIVRPQKQNWAQTLTANGNIAAWQEVIIGSELSGQRLTKVNVNIGDKVRRGQVLAEINSQTIRADLANAKANLAEAKALEAEASSNNRRFQQLKNTGAISARELTQYQTSQSTAQARVDAARAQIESHELRLAQTQVIAPDNGVISVRTATVGSLAQTGQELFRLIRDQRLEWRAEVTTTDLYKLKQGMSVQIFSPDPTQAPVIGKIRMLAPVINPETRYGLVYVDLPVTQDLRMGMFVKGEFELGQKEAITIPQSALLLRDGFSYVFIVNKDSRVIQHKITIGRRLGHLVEVIGLADNMNIVATGAGFLADGDLVKITDSIPDTPLSKQLNINQGE